MRSILLTGFSFLLTAAVICNGYYQKQQFYPSVVYITKSNASMAVLYLQALVLIILMGKFMRKIFFGQLRAAEMEHLIERSWYAVTETCLAFTVFRDDFSPRFVASFTFLLFLKSFHWLAEDRVDYMERSPLISCVFHTRVISLLAFLGLLDTYFMSYAYHSTIMKGASVQLVFGFEYAILATVVVMTFMKYIMHSIDLQNENPWENKAVYLLYTELVIGSMKVALYVAFMTIMIKVHTFPLFAIRPMYITLRSFKKALHDVIMSRRAIRNMNTLYADATPEEIAAGDSVCIICREEMVTACKKLPCNHIYHTSCLRSWFQRQQTCPTCRMDVLRTPRPTPPTPPPAPQQPHQPPHAPQMPHFPMMPGVWPPMGFPPQPPHMPPHQPATTTTGTPTTTQPSQSTTQPPFTPPPYQSFMPQMPQMPQPFFMPTMPMEMPRPPADLSTMSTEDLTSMEGHQRHHVSMRLQWLQDITTLLDTAMMMVNQYNDVAAALSIPPISSLTSPLAPSAPHATTVTSSTGGARPKTSTIPPPAVYHPPTHHIPATTPQPTSTTHLAGEETEGASGYTPPTEELIPEWRGEDGANDSMTEVRRRRLEKFASDDSPKDASSDASVNGSNDGNKVTDSVVVGGDTKMD